MKSFLSMPPLREGDTIAVIRPAGRLDETHYNQTIRSIRELGFCVAEFAGRWKKDSYFSATDENRAAEIQWAFSEPGIRLVLAARGGYGCQRALDLISDKDLKKWQPKIFVGYSDITFMHQWIQNRLKWITFHGPLAGHLNKAALSKLLKNLVALPSNASSEIFSETKTIGKNSSAAGRLVGGNLSLLQSAGSGALPKEKLILALEDIGENFYRLDRMIWNLIGAGYDQYIEAIILGTFHQCGEKDSKTFGKAKFYESLKRLCSGPILEGARFGHGMREQGKIQRLLPLGARVKLKGKKLYYLDALTARI